jgi:acetolactate synthase I/III small subunit
MSNSAVQPRSILNGKSPLRRRHLFVVHVENKPGVLDRVASLFRRRSYNIESLTVGRTDQDGVSRMTLVIEGDDTTARLMEANLYKLVNVLHVENLSFEPAVVRDLALIKVKASATERAQVLQLAEVFRARVVDIGPKTVVVEITGAEEKIQGLVEVLEPYGILEMVRTGAVAMKRGPDVAEVATSPAAVSDSESAA